MSSLVQGHPRLYSKKLSQHKQTNKQMGALHPGYHDPPTLLPGDKTLIQTSTQQPGRRV